MCSINCSGGCIECAPDEHEAWFIDRRIACPPNYPYHEAKFDNVYQYVEHLENTWPTRDDA